MVFPNFYDGLREDKVQSHNGGTLIAGFLEVHLESRHCVIYILFRPRTLVQSVLFARRSITAYNISIMPLSILQT